MNITRENTMCVVIDLQEKLLPAIDQQEDVVNSTVKLLSSLSVLGIPVLVTQQYTKGLGETVSPIQQALNMPEENKAFEKITFSAYENEEIRSAIMNANVQNILFCGTEAHICVLQSCIDFQKNGWQSVMVADCVGSRKSLDKEMAFRRCALEGVALSTTEAVVFELLKQAGTQDFRQVMQFIK